MNNAAAWGRLRVRVTFSSDRTGPEDDGKRARFEIFVAPPPLSSKEDNLAVDFRPLVRVKHRVLARIDRTPYCDEMCRSERIFYLYRFYRRFFF